MRKLLSAGIIREFVFDTEEEKDSYKNFLACKGKAYQILREGMLTIPGKEPKHWLLTIEQYNNNRLCREVQ